MRTLRQCILSLPCLLCSSWYHLPLSLAIPQNPIASALSRRWQGCVERAQLEQEVDDANADWMARSSNTGVAASHRRLIALPLDETLFDPPMGQFSHNHVQTGDKMSLPSNFWNAIQLNGADVPWLFTVSRVQGVTSEPRVQLELPSPDTITETQPSKALESVVGGPLDFRAPKGYVFLPLWMMRALGLRPRDIVQVTQVLDTPPGSLAKLRPHSNDFGNDISNPQAVLETELRHYSSLTAGSTIAFDYNHKRYWFDVVQVRSAPRGQTVPVIKVQDCDIATDFLPSRVVLVEQLRKKRAREREVQEVRNATAGRE